MNFLPIMARIKVGTERERFLGAFHSMAQAVRLLCPPPSYREIVTNRDTGEAHERVRRQVAGLVLTPEQANFLLENHRLTFKQQQLEITVLFVRLPESGIYVPQLVDHPRHEWTSEEIHHEELAAIALSKRSSVNL